MSDDLKKLLDEFSNDKLDDSHRRLKRALLDTGMSAATKEGSFGVLRRSLLAGMIASSVLVVDGKMTSEDLDKTTRDVFVLASYTVARALAKNGRRVCRSAGPIVEPMPPPPVAKSGKTLAKPAAASVAKKSAISKQSLPVKKRR